MKITLKYTGEKSHQFVLVTSMESMADCSSYEELQLMKVFLVLLKSKGILIKEDALRQLTSTAIQHFHQLSDHLQQYTELQRRRKPIYDDIELLFRLKKIKSNDIYTESLRSKRIHEDNREQLKLIDSHPNDIEEYSEESLPFFHNQQYDISELVHSQVGRPDYIPSYLPDLPPDYTYQNTPNYVDTITDLKTLRVNLVNQSRATEISLYELIDDEKRKWRIKFEQELEELDELSPVEDIMSDYEVESPLEHDLQKSDLDGKIDGEDGSDDVNKVYDEEVLDSAKVIEEVDVEGVSNGVKTTDISGAEGHSNGAETTEAVDEEELSNKARTFETVNEINEEVVTTKPTSPLEDVEMSNPDDNEGSAKDGKDGIRLATEVQQELNDHPTQIDTSLSSQESTIKDVETKEVVDVETKDGESAIQTTDKETNVDASTSNTEDARSQDDEINKPALLTPIKELPEAESKSSINVLQNEGASENVVQDSIVEENPEAYNDEEAKILEPKPDTSDESKPINNSANETPSVLPSKPEKVDQEPTHVTDTVKDDLDKNSTSTETTVQVVGDENATDKSTEKVEPVEDVVGEPDQTMKAVSIETNNIPTISITTNENKSFTNFLTSMKYDYGLDADVEIPARPVDKSKSFDFVAYAKLRRSIQDRKIEELKEKRLKRKKNIYLRAEKYFGPYSSLEVTEKIEEKINTILSRSFKKCIKTIRIEEEAKKARLDRLVAQKEREEKEAELERQKSEFVFGFNPNNGYSSDSEDEFPDFDIKEKENEIKAENQEEQDDGLVFPTFDDAEDDLGLELQNIMEGELNEMEVDAVPIESDEDMAI